MASHQVCRGKKLTFIVSSSGREIITEKKKSLFHERKRVDRGGAGERPGERTSGLQVEDVGEEKALFATDRESNFKGRRRNNAGKEKGSPVQPR